MNPSRRWCLAEFHHVASSLAKRSNPNTKANQTQNSANQTQSTEVFIKKKKIPNTQTKTKASNPRTVTSSPQRAPRRRRRNSRPSSQIDIDIVDGRSVIGSLLYRLRLCLCAGEWSSSASLLPPAVRPSLKVFLSNSLSDSQSLSLFISLND